MHMTYMKKCEHGRLIMGGNLRKLACDLQDNILIEPKTRTFGSMVQNGTPWYTMVQIPIYHV